MEPAPPTVGLYVHVPYCKALCHYCDFAKTANFTPGQSAAYLAALDAHLAAWLEEPAVRDRLGAGFTSVFFGGGTPSLFTDEYAPLFERLRPHLAAGCEVSLECNPDDVTRARLEHWRALGVTRLSLGVQTFDAPGLERLKRVHGAAEATAAIAAARDVFPNLNVDLIYGWPGQTPAIWESDLRQVLGLGVQHLSLYTLTYEPRTPIGRAALRGRIVPQADEGVADFYETARRLLAEGGFEHEEVSNWSRPGASCAHNWLYWSDRSYVGIGAGAHGYLADAAGPGERYAYDRSERAFAKWELPRAADHAARFGVAVEGDRTLDDWVTEVVGASLRTVRGVPLQAALARGGWLFAPTPLLKKAFDEGLATLGADGRLRLMAAEWFRETAWAVEILRSLRPA